MTDTLPALDKAPLEAEAAACAAHFAAIDDLEQRLRGVSHEYLHHARIADRLRPRMTAAALSLAFYDNVPTLEKVIGVNRTRWYLVRCEALGLVTTVTGDDGKPRKVVDQWLVNATAEQVRARAEEYGVKHVTGAVKKLRQLAEDYTRAEAFKKALRPIRDDAAVVFLLPPHEWSRATLAKIMGVNESRLSHIRRAAGKPKERVPA